MIEPAQALEAIGQLPDAEIDLADAALQLGRALTPERATEAAAAHLSELARESAAIGRALDGRSLDTRLGGLAGLIHARHGYAGDDDTYDDLANANLIAVIDRRRGLPVALGIIWLHCIRSAGWDGHGIDFPGHFLLQMNGVAAAPPRRGGKRDQHVLVDAFAGGNSVAISDLLGLLRSQLGETAEIRPGMLRPMSNRDVLLRLQRNNTERMLGSGELESALAALETMIAIAPEQASLWRDAAGLNQRLQRFRAAIECLEHFLILVPEGEAAKRARARISEIRTRLA